MLSVQYVSEFMVSVSVELDLITEIYFSYFQIWLAVFFLEEFEQICYAYPHCCILLLDMLMSLRPSIPNILFSSFILLTVASLH